MAIVLRSFAELAKAFGCEKKAEAVVSDKPYQSVERKCGRIAAIVWAMLNDRESCKRYGPNGSIYNRPEDIAEATGIPVEECETASIKLICNGYARYSSAGYIKAA